MGLLTVIVYAAAVIGVVAAGAAWALPQRRVRLLVVAALAFAVAGVPSVASIGMGLLLLSAVCATLAIRTASSRPA